MKLELPDIIIEHAHRLHKGNMIICKLLKYEDKIRILSKWKILRTFQPKIYVNEDFPSTIQKERYEL